MPSITCNRRVRRARPKRICRNKLNTLSRKLLQAARPAIDQHRLDDADRMLDGGTKHRRIPTDHCSSATRFECGAR